MRQALRGHGRHRRRARFPGRRKQRQRGPADIGDAVKAVIPRHFRLGCRRALARHFPVRPHLHRRRLREGSSDKNEEGEETGDHREEESGLAGELNGHTAGLWSVFDLSGGNHHNRTFRFSLPIRSCKFAFWVIIPYPESSALWTRNSPSSKRHLRLPSNIGSSWEFFQVPERLSRFPTCRSSHVIDLG